MLKKIKLRYKFNTIKIKISWGNTSYKEKK